MENGMNGMLTASRLALGKWMNIFTESDRIEWLEDEC